MGIARLSLAERFLPLAHADERAVSYQNILELDESRLLEKLERLRETIASSKRKALRFDAFFRGAQEITSFSECVHAMREVAGADSISHSGTPAPEEIVIVRNKRAASLSTEHFLLARIKRSFDFISTHFGNRIDGCNDTCEKSYRTLERDHVMEFYRTLTILPVQREGTQDEIREVIVTMPSIQNGRILTQSEREDYFLYTLEMLKLYCYPGIHKTGFAASLTPIVTVGSIGVMKHADNKGFDMLKQVLWEQLVAESVGM